MTRWEFFIPWAVALESAILAPVELRVLDNLLTVVTKESVETELGPETLSLKQLARLLPQMPHSPTITPIFLRFSEEGTSWSEAWDIVTPAFDALRGGMEYLFGMRMLRMGLSEYEPLARIPHPEWMLYKAGTGTVVKGVPFIYEYSHPRRRDPMTITAGALAALREFILIIERSPAEGTTPALIADVFRLFAQAMDANLPHANFLGLWQVCEAVALSTWIKGDTTKVCRRLEWHAERLGLPGSGFSRSLRAFAEKRNRIVHRGLRGIDQDDVNDLLLITDIAVAWLHGQAERLPTENALEAFYRFRTTSDADRNSARTALDYLKAEREQGSNRPEGRS